MKKIIMLVIVVVILGIIGIVAFLFQDQNDRNRTEKVADKFNVMSNLSSLRISAEVFASAENNYSYTGFCTTNLNGVDSVFKAIAEKNGVGESGIHCTANETAFAITSVLPDGTYYCVDSKGGRTETETFHTGTACN